MQAKYKSADAIIHQQNALKSSIKLPIEWKVFLVSESKDLKVRQGRVPKRVQTYFASLYRQ